MAESIRETEVESDVMSRIYLCPTERDWHW